MADARTFLGMAGLLALAACSPTLGDTDADNLENEIRSTYEERGAEVIEVDIAVVDAQNLEGTVRLRDPQNGEEVTNNCTAELEEGETEYQWNCAPPQ